MKPARLMLKAFGPFANREEVDFTRLPSDALFLIHGPTGAGKTSILDGICYALYGETSGSERTAKEMRSHHAPDDMLTEVEFEFALGGKRFLVRRSPEQERAALRGNREQLVKSNAKAELQAWEDDPDGEGSWKPIVSKSTEVTERIIALLGFEADQFRQVIMLPQGQFRKLLTADSKEREKILEALFSTETYKRLQERLNTAARNLEQQAKEATARQTTLIEQAGVESEGALKARVNEATTQLTTLAGLEKLRRAEDTATSATLIAGEALALQFKERDGARVALDKLNADASAIDAKRRHLEAATRAQLVIPAHASFRDAIRQQQEFAQQVASAGREFEIATRRFQAAETTLKAENDREPEREMSAREVARLEGLREAVQKLDEAQRDHASSTQAAQVVVAEYTGLQKQHETWTAQRAQLQQAIDTQTPLAARAEALQLNIGQQEQLVQSLKKLVQAEATLATSRAEEAELRKIWEGALAKRLAASQHKDALEACWRSGQAVVLARHLSTGTPCPVCGSLDHPQPVTQSGVVPTETEMEAAAADLQKTENETESARTRHHAAVSKIAGEESIVSTLRTALPAERPGLQNAEQALLALKDEQSAASKAASILNKAKGEIQACEQRLATATQAQEQARSKVEAVNLQVATSASRVQERAATVPENLRNAETLEQAIKSARAQADKLVNQFKSAQSLHQQASATHAAAQSKQNTLAESLKAVEARVADAREAFIKALRDHGFDDESAFNQAALPSAEIATRRADLQSHDEAVAAAKERLLRAEGSVAGKMSPDLVALKAAQQSARQAVESLLAQQNSLKEKIAYDRKTLESLATIRQELGDLDARYKVMGYLAGIANGENSKKLTFQRFVLAALLDDVLRQASLRLRTMSRGRYTLQRRQDVADARKASGLDLEVFDDYTGRARPASTLSGGEGFMAALSLALGLSDVVQAYAGGIQLDTLFIDEGFGSLDPESLDMAMKALIDLQQKGRMVGIISHVDDLKRQINSGIEVTLGAAGSHVRVGTAV